MPLNKYAPQVATHRRTQNAILEATKQLISTTGLKKMSMIEIADVSEVSRATLYNHYRDKESVIRSLCESEMQRLVHIAQVAPDATAALEQISIEISHDKALAAMRTQDPDLLTIALAAQEDVLWKAFAIAIAHLLGNEKGELATRWLIGQALHPINPAQSRAQAEAIIAIANL
jgi:TetR/AcrR family transcriptional regulator, transcriptional repressor of aconitase